MKAHESTGGISRWEYPPSTIQALFLTSRPFHVARLVIAVIVNALDGMAFGRLTSNSIKKCLKGLKPFLADGNASTTVVLVALAVWVKTTAFHLQPAAVFRRILAASTLAMSNRSSWMTLFRQFSSKATTTVGMHQLIPAENSKRPAVTTAVPHSISRFDFGSFKDYPSTEALSDAVFQVLHTPQSSVSSVLIQVNG